jgi:hypothetical protein
MYSSRSKLKTGVLCILVFGCVWLCLVGCRVLRGEKRAVGLGIRYCHGAWTNNLCICVVVPVREAKKFFSATQVQKNNHRRIIKISDGVCLTHHRKHFLNKSGGRFLLWAFGAYYSHDNSHKWMSR